MATPIHPLVRSVGQGGANDRQDVKLTQMLLNNWLGSGHGVALKVDGTCGPKTLQAVAAFQRSLGGVVDGRIDPKGPTIAALVSLQIQMLQQGAKPALGYIGRARASQPLTNVPAPPDLHEAVARFLAALRDQLK